jgi:hypothetical protein
MDNRRTIMRSTFSHVASAALVLATVACAPRIDVRTMAAPDAALASLHSFRVLPTPPRRDRRMVQGSDDPMIDNSIANQTLRDGITKAFQERGYMLNELTPDFTVAFYAAAREKLDVTVWDYGYPFRPRWPYYSHQTATEYTEGSVVVDVLDARNGALLWRGEGKAEVSEQPMEMVRQLVKAANVIIARFPQAPPRAIAN